MPVRLCCSTIRGIISDALFGVGKTFVHPLSLLRARRLAFALLLSPDMSGERLHRREFCFPRNPVARCAVVAESLSRFSARTLYRPQVDAVVAGQLPG